MMATRAAIYLRVSRGDQTNENQRPDVERVVETRRLELVTIRLAQLARDEETLRTGKTTLREKHRLRLDMLRRVGVAA